MGKKIEIGQKWRVYSDEDKKIEWTFKIVAHEKDIKGRNLWIAITYKGNFATPLSDVFDDNGKAAAGGDSPMNFYLVKKIK